MKNRTSFIVPKILGITVLVGVATFVLAMVFKLLVAGLVLAGIGTLIAKAVGKRRRYFDRQDYYQQAISNYQFNQDNLALSPMRQSVSNDSAIIPIY